MELIIKRRLQLIALAILVFVLLPLAYHLLTTGRLVINTTIPNSSLQISKLGDDGSLKTVASTTTNSISARLSPGRYAARVVSKSNIISQSFLVKARQSLHYTFKPRPLSDLEPVSTINANFLAANASNLNYLDQTSQQLFQIDTQNNLNGISPNIKFLGIAWAGPSYGIGEDTSGRFYEISGLVAAPLSLPFSVKANDNSVHFALSSNRTLFVSHGKDIYAAAEGVNLKKIYTAEIAPTSLSATNNKLAIVQAPGDKNDSNNQSVSLLVAIDSSGKLLAQSSTAAESAVWSPDSKHLSVLTPSLNEVMLDDSLKSVGVVSSSSSIVSQTWLDNNTLMYVTGEGLWKYSLQAGDSGLLSDVPSGESASSIVVDSAHSYAYISTSPAGSETASHIYRYGLNGQKVPSYIYQLPIVIANSIEDCPLSYINFSRPTILVYSSDPNPQQACAASIEDAFGTYGIDTSLLNFNYVPINISAVGE